MARPSQPPGPAALLLAGDVGGTHTRLATFALHDDGRLEVHSRHDYPSARHAGLEHMLVDFVARLETPIDGACFGLPGPVRGPEVHLTNLPWAVDAHRLAASLGLGRVALLNDLEANTHGIAALSGEDLVTLNTGATRATGNIAVVSAGTGLGEAAAYWDGRRHRPFASEGGHASYAPRTDVEMELLRWLGARTGGHVSWERIVSGPGLVSIYEFLRDSGRGKEPGWLREEMRTEDPAAVIARHGLGADSPLCEAALDLFVTAYGAEAGNLALKVMATGGVYLGGGVAPKLRARFSDGRFVHAFCDHGRMGGLLRSMPVYLIVREDTALLGAARYAALEQGLLD